MSFLCHLVCFASCSLSCVCDLYQFYNKNIQFFVHFIFTNMFSRDLRLIFPIGWTVLDHMTRGGSIIMMRMHPWASRTPVLTDMEPMSTMIIIKPNLCHLPSLTFPLRFENHWWTHSLTWPDIRLSFLFCLIFIKEYSNKKNWVVCLLHRDGHICLSASQGWF